MVLPSEAKVASFKIIVRGLALCMFTSATL